LRVERTAAEAWGATPTDRARRALWIAAAVIGLLFGIPRLWPSALWESAPTISVKEPAASASKSSQAAEAERQAEEKPTVVTFSLCSTAAWSGGGGGDLPQQADPLVKSVDFAGFSNAIFRTPRDVAPGERGAVRAGYTSARRVDAKSHRKASNDARLALHADTEGIVLTSTILGSARRAAIVNGRLYREGDRLLVGRTALRILKVGENQIEVVHDGKVHGRNHHRIIHIAPPAQPDEWLTKQPQLLRGHSEAG
jgi:hypothetical protein